jgi:lipopolysaccharide transport system ATP-binding protein
MTHSEPPIIIAEHLCKRYVRTEYRPSLRHEALNMARKLLQGRQGGTFQAQPFNALDDVSFTIARGEAVGIIGRNGSGKTTLLRLLSGIAQPTSGTLTVRGRFAALIGLAAGFLPELSGRKNIYLNAAIQGVPPKQIEPLVEEIIEFAEIRSFIDTPVKNYSTGMGARLGFSIAVHILPEIVFIDEVLAVGDAAFQAKCTERMLQLKSEGRTIVFVSHDAYQVGLLCDRCLWLHNGKLMADGEARAVLAEYAAATAAV